MRYLFFTLFLFAIGLQSNAQQELTLEQAVLQQWGSFYPQHTAAVKWIPGTSNYSFVSADYLTLKKGNVKNDKAEDLVTLAELNDWTGMTFPWMRIDRWKDENSFYAHNAGKFFLVDIAAKKATALVELPDGADNAEMCYENMQVAYTVDNNLYIRGEKNAENRITNEEAHIVSGQAIARREFGIVDGIFWSTSGKFLAFYQKDESMVADYPLLDITTPTGSLNSIKYPMAGQTSEKPKVGIYNVASKKTVYIQPRGADDDYLTNVSWGPKDEFVYVVEVNRNQDHAKVQKYNAETGDFVATLFEEQNEKWVEPEHALHFVNDNQFVYMSERDGFMNLYLYSDKGDLVKQLTTNKWVAQSIIGHDAAGNVYFQGTGESPLQTNYFKVNIGSGKQTALTNDGTHSATFSADFAYFFDAMSSHDTPNLEGIYETKKRKKLREVLKADNPYEGVTMGTAEIGTIEAGDNETVLYHRLIKPSNFDPSKKYPVLVYVYGGPHAQLITDSWLDGASLWMYWMAEQGYLVYTVDGRGSANRGFAFESCIHRQLGTKEMEDQLQGVQYLQSLPYVDGERLAVHGWSFGGYMTTSLMLRNAGVFNVGVAGGPVTDWSYYEVMYGERYMDQPSQNVKGYKESSLMNYVENLKGDLLLIHGTIDDVVVMQHNYALVQAFVEAGVQMDFFPYPMHKHNVRGKDRVHLMRKVLTYVIEHNK
ncbi:MAG: S9 family peptidase [Flavobacteriales bacterium]|nr:S9 family peptidase [Flavobacteriales bacterium]